MFTDISTYSSLPTWLLAVVLAWSLVWKGLALWKSSKKDSKIWFVVILLTNTVGIIEILYIFLFSKMNINKVTPMKKVAKKTAKKRTKR